MTWGVEALARTSSVKEAQAVRSYIERLWEIGREVVRMLLERLRGMAFSV